MSTDEQDKIIGRALREKRAAERELKCWRDKALRMGRTLSTVDTALRNVGHHGRPDMSDALQKSMKDYPSKEEVETA